MLHKVTTTSDALQVYRERDLGSTAIAQVRKGIEIQLSAATVHQGREWMEATLADGSAGYVFGPNARGHTTLGGTPLGSPPQTSASPDAVILRCRTCGQYADTRLVSINQNIGAITMRSVKSIDGELCKKCIRKYSLKYTMVSVVFGWWGLISFFVTPVYIVTNIYHYCRTFRMKG